MHIWLHISTNLKQDVQKVTGFLIYVYKTRYSPSLTLLILGLPYLIVYGELTFTYNGTANTS